MSKVNVNSANKQELIEKLGLNEVVAERVVRVRDGAPFTSLQDLVDNVEGLGPATAEKIAELIEFGVTSGEGALSYTNFCDRYLAMIHDFTEALPLLSDSEDISSRLYHLGGRLYSATSKWIKIAKRHAEEPITLSEAAISALGRAEAIVQYIDHVYIGQNLKYERPFSDLEYASLVRTMSLDTMDSLFNTLAQGGLDPSGAYFISTPLFPLLQAADEGDDTPSFRERLVALLTRFKDNGLLRRLIEIKAISTPLLIYILRLVGIPIPEGLPNEQLNQFIDTTAAALGIAPRTGGKCHIDVKLEKVTLSSDDIGTDGWFLEFTIEGDSVRVPESGVLSFSKVGNQYEATFDPPKLLADPVKDGCGEHLINVNMEATETEFLDTPDRDSGAGTFKVICGGEPTREMLAIRVSENEGSQFVDTSTTVTVTAHFVIESDCR